MLTYPKRNPGARRMKFPYFVARASLAWVFVRAGTDVLQHPEGKAKAARPVLDWARSASPVPLPHDIALVRANAATHVVAGSALALGVKPRLAAAVLMGSLVPTTWGGHPFWRFDEPEARAGQFSHFNKNVAVFGGLLLVLLAGGKPVRKGR